MLPIHRMELRHLRYFQVVAETLSFSRASERLRIAQSAISRQIAALEAELDVKLFVRSTTRVRLTDAGRHFHQEVNHLLARLDIAITGAQEIAGGRGGELNLGSDWRIHLPGFPDAVREFRELKPKVTINYVELAVHEQVEALRDGRIHLGFVHEGAILNQGDALCSEPLYTAEMKLVVGSGHRLAKAGSVLIKDLRDETWVRLDERKHPGFRTFMIQLCHAALFTPKFGRTAQSIHAMLAHVTTGDGICIMPTSFIPPAYSDLCVLDTDCPPFEFYAVWMKDSPGAARDTFLASLKGALAPAG